jgi:hypothetical protein
MPATHVVVGGGSAGCTVAAPLSERPRNRVVLIEAGSDHAPDAPPGDILDTFAGRALTNPSYFWPNLRVRRSDGEHLSERGRAPFFFEQARLIGGGSDGLLRRIRRRAGPATGGEAGAAPAARPDGGVGRGRGSSGQRAPRKAQAPRNRDARSSSPPIRDRFPAMSNDTVQSPPPPGSRQGVSSGTAS